MSTTDGGGRGGPLGEKAGEPQRLRYCICSRANAMHGVARAICPLHGNAETSTAYRAGFRDALNGFSEPEARPIRAEDAAPHPMVTDVRDYLDNAGITPETLRYAATHESLCRSWIYDLLTGLAHTLDPHTPPGAES